MKVADVFQGWFRQGKAEALAEFFANVLDRDVVSRNKESGVGAYGEIPLTVHTVQFTGAHVERRVCPKRRETWIDGNTLSYPT